MKAVVCFYLLSAIYAVCSLAYQYQSPLPITSFATLEKLINSARLSERGQKQNSATKTALEIIEELEEKGRGLDISPQVLAGSWELCFATDDVTRSSPFFWAFRKSLDGRKSNSRLSLRKTNDLSESILTITDRIPAPLKVIGTASQEIYFPFEDTSSIDEDGVPVLGTLESEVVVKALKVSSSIMKTTSTIQKIENEPNLFEIGVKTTEVVTKNPAVRLVKFAFTPAFREVGMVRVANAIQAFPSGGALERVKSGSSTVQMRVTYLDDTIRIVRPDNNLDCEEGTVFVYRRL